MSDVVLEMLDGLVLKSAPKSDSLEDSLEAYTKPNLLKLAELNDFEVMKSWNKGQIIEVISERLRDSSEERFSTFENEQLAGLQGLLNGKTDQVDTYRETIVSAVKKGLLYVSANDDVLFTMPAEFKEDLNESVVLDESAADEESPADRVVNQPVRNVPFAQRTQRKQPVQQRIVGKKVGRNDPCPCGSGKKYKKCCWSKDQSIKAG